MSLVMLSRNYQYYDAIMSIWNQLYINIKSLISWQFCVKDINHINSLTLSMVRLSYAKTSFAVQHFIWLSKKQPIRMGVYWTRHVLSL